MFPKEYRSGPVYIIGIHIEIGKETNSSRFVGRWRIYGVFGISPIPVFQSSLLLPCCYLSLYFLFLFSLIVCARVQQPAKRCISFPFFITLTRLLLLNILFFLLLLPLMLFSSAQPWHRYASRILRLSFLVAGWTRTIDGDRGATGRRRRRICKRKYQ